MATIAPVLAGQFLIGQVGEDPLEKYVKRMMEGGISYSQQGDINDFHAFFSKISLEKTEVLLEVASPLLESELVVSGRLLILSVLIEVDPEKRTNLVLKTLPLLKEIEEGRGKSQILKQLSLFEDEESLSSMVDFTMKVLEGLRGRYGHDAWQCSKLLEVLSAIPDEKKEKMVKEVVSIIKKTPLINVLDRANLLSFLAEIDIDGEKRLSFIEEATSYLERNEKIRDLAGFLRILYAIPEKERKDKRIQDALYSFLKLNDLRHVCNIINKIPHEKRSALVWVFPFLTNETDVGAHFSQCVLVLARMDEEEWKEETCKALLTITRGAYPNQNQLFAANELQLYQLYTALYAIPSREIAAVLRAVAPFIVKGTWFFPLEQRIALLYAAANCEEREVMIPQFNQVLSTASEEQRSALKSYHLILSLLPISLWIDLLQGKIPSVQTLFSDEGIKKTVLYTIKQWVESDEGKMAYALSEIIGAHKPTLGLIEEDPFFQEVVRLNVLTSEEALNNVKNPFRIFQRLKEGAATVLLEEEIDLPSVRLPTRGGGKHLSWNVKGLRERGESRVLRVSDLPPSAKEEAVKNLFTSLKERLNKLDEKEKEAVLKEITHFGSSLGQLEKNLLEGSLTQFLHTIPKDPDALISLSQFQLFAIISEIEMKSNEIKEGKLLSKREEMLLSLAESIKACETGQQDDLSRAYNLIIPPHKRPHLTLEGGYSEPGARFVINCVQSSLQQIFHSHQLLTTLLGENVEGESHQTMYLKNRLFREVGLHHRFTFDSQTYSLDDKLFQMDNKKLVNIFMKLFTPDFAAKELMRQSKLFFTSDESHPISPHTTFCSLWNQKRGRELLNHEFSRYIQFDSSFKPIGLTLRGAYLSLRVMGYAKVEKTTDKHHSQRVQALDLYPPMKGSRQIALA